MQLVRSFSKARLLSVTASCGPVASPVAHCETFACVLEVSMMTCMTILKDKGHAGLLL